MIFFEEIKDTIIAGIMTGTSLDGIDIAFVKFFKLNNLLQFDVLAFQTFKFDNEFQKKLENIIELKAYIDTISEVNFELSSFYLQSVLQLCKEKKIPLDNIDAIGMHGQTVWHYPLNHIPNTFQLGSISALSKMINKIVVGDFRSADVALGGQGAPLVPIFDYTFLKSDKEDRIALNIGGIANITFLKTGTSIEEVIGFDTGPGNSLIDCFTKKYFGFDYDKSGEIASNGRVIPPFFEKLKQNQYFSILPPKSTGKEMFNYEYAISLLNSIDNTSYSFEDVIRTLTEFTVWSIALGIKSLTNSNPLIIASGGGVHNDFLMKRLAEELPKSKVIKSDAYGINPDAKEAICFAYLAYLTLNKVPSNIPSVTGAKRRTVLGTIALPD